MGSPFQVRKRLKRQAKRAAHIAFRLVFSRGSDDSDVVDVSQTPSPPTAPPVEKRADTTPAKGSPVDDIQPVAEDIAPAPKIGSEKTGCEKTAKTSTTSKAKTASSAKSKSTKAKAAAATKRESGNRRRNQSLQSRRAKKKKAKSDSEKPSDPAPSKEEQAAQRQKAHWEKTRLGY